MGDDNIQRTEFESRISELRAMIFSMNAELSNTVKLIYDLNKETRETFHEEMGNLSVKVDGVIVQNWKLVALSVVNFLVGGGMVALVEFLIHH